MPPRFADPASPSRPLHVVPKDRLADWLAAQPERSRGLAQPAAFGAALGEVALLPGNDGRRCAVVGYGTAEDPGARCASVWQRPRRAARRRLAPCGRLAPHERDEAALGWLLAQYRFDRYPRRKPAAAQLKAPAGLRCGADRGHRGRRMPDARSDQHARLRPRPRRNWKMPSSRWPNARRSRMPRSGAMTCWRRTSR